MIRFDDHLLTDIQVSIKEDDYANGILNYYSQILSSRVEQIDLFRIDRTVCIIT